jgi:hypothetical protein
MMNKKYLFGLSALTIIFGACSDDIKPEYSSDNLAVHFSAQVGKTVSRSSSENLEEGATVNISNDGDYYSYTADSNGDLTPAGSDFVRWASNSQSTMSIKAYTPIIDGASAEAFSLANLKDQSSTENLANADFATFDGTVSRITGSNNVSFSLQRRMTQVKINIASVDSRYTSTTSDKYTFDLTVYSPSTSITISDGTVSGDGAACAVTPYNGTGIALGGTAVAIITPGAASTDAEFIAVQVKKNGDATGSPLIATGRQALNAGYSYTFNLAVNNDGISISSVQVTDWLSVDTLTGGDASDEYYVINLDNYTSADDVRAEIKRLNEEGSVTAISFIGEIGEMTLNDFFLDSSDSANPVWLPIERIDLSGITDLTEIPNNSFYENTYLRRIRATQVTTVGKYAFYGCKSLTSIDLPVATLIQDNAFWKCIALTSVSLPAATTIVGAFFYCTSLTSISLPVATSVDGFSFCSSLTSISLPAATTIGKKYYTFEYCTSLTSISLPVATYVSGFEYCTSLTNISLPVATYVSGFDGCTSLTSISLPEATMLGESAFSGCTALTSISLPAATMLGDYAFKGCTALTSISLPAATTIGKSAFQNCTSLTSISLPNVTEIASGNIETPNAYVAGAFYGCTALTDISLPKATTIGDCAFYGCTTLANIDLPAATTIGNYAFSGCTALTKISLPKAISVKGFNSCTALTSIDLPVATYVYFYGCTAVTSVSLPEATSAYLYDCTALTSANLPTATIVGLLGCTSLTSVDLPAATTIGYNAFKDCTSLKSVRMPKATNFSSDIFRNCFEII